MGVVASQIASNSTVYLTISFGQHQRNIKARHYQPFQRGITLWPQTEPANHFPQKRLDDAKIDAIACISVVTEAEYTPELDPTKHNPYLAQTDAL